MYENIKNTIENTKKILFVDESPVFKFINPNGNDKLSEMSGFDLQDLIILIDDYYIKLRNRLGFEKYITFGLELEFENAMRFRIDRQLNEVFPRGYWGTKYDSTLNDGVEINSPILRDTTLAWENLNKICSIVKPLASVGENSGGHIHVGTQTLGNKKVSWLNFIKIWSVYENIIFRFAYGDFLTPRSSIQKYATPVAKIFWKDYKYLKNKNSDLDTIIDRISHKRNQAVNFSNVSNYNKLGTKNTIEFRCPNSSLNPAIWQNNVNFFVNLLTYCRNSSFNNDLIEQRHKLNSNKFLELKWYDEVYLEQALELCDMIFTNNFDKVYFLKQYLKSFQVWNENTYYQKTLN